MGNHVGISKAISGASLTEISDKFNDDIPGGNLENIPEKRLEKSLENSLKTGAILRTYFYNNSCKIFHRNSYKSSWIIREISGKMSHEDPAEISEVLNEFLEQQSQSFFFFILEGFLRGVPGRVITGVAV